MSALNKEKIFEDLRNYHTHKFSAKIKNPELENLRAEFMEMEDRIVGMLLSLVNGKAEFVDSTKDLDSFQKKFNAAIAIDHSDSASQELFASKIATLTELMEYAKNSEFKLRRIRTGVNPNRVPRNKITVT